MLLLPPSQRLYYILGGIVCLPEGRTWRIGLGLFVLGNSSHHCLFKYLVLLWFGMFEHLHHGFHSDGDSIGLCIHGNHNWVKYSRWYQGSIGGGRLVVSAGGCSESLNSTWKIAKCGTWSGRGLDITSWNSLGSTHTNRWEIIILTVVFIPCGCFRNRIIDNLLMYNTFYCWVVPSLRVRCSVRCCSCLYSFGCLLEFES